MPSTLYTSGFPAREIKDEVDNELLCRLTLTPGTKYLVQTQGHIGPPDAQATLNLTVLDWGSGDPIESRSVELKAGFDAQTFSLMLPAEISPVTGAGYPPPPEPVATLSVKLRGELLKLMWHSPVGKEPHVLIQSQIFALAVDEIVRPA